VRKKIDGDQKIFIFRYIDNNNKKFALLFIVETLCILKNIDNLKIN
jgi:hypothetical protein